MTVINGMRMSKYDIQALKVGQKVTAQMRNDLAEFNKNFVGENSMFPVKNGAPRILTQFKEDPYVLELQAPRSVHNRKQTQETPYRWS